MKIFIDSADIEEIRQAKKWGMLDGVTTNPSLIKKAVEKLHKQKKKINIKEYISQFLREAKGKPVSLEVIGTNFTDMVHEGIHLYHLFNPIARNVYIKIPVNPCLADTGNCDVEEPHKPRPLGRRLLEHPKVSDKPRTLVRGKTQRLCDSEGIRAIHALAQQGIPVNCTLIFTPEQALLAAKAGAKIVSPFVGREDDYIRELNKSKFKKEDYFPAEGMKKLKKWKDDNGIVSGVELIRECKTLFVIQKVKGCEILAASIRNTRQFREVALAGAEIATLPLSVMEKLLEHPKTQEGMRQFTKDIVPEYAMIAGSARKKK